MMTKLLKEVIRKKNHDEIPLWFMRQAGRYLPEYRKIREKYHDFFDMCYDSDVACEISLLPVKRFDIDGIIIFSDILVLPKALGIDVKFVENYGPVIDFNHNTFLDIKEYNCIHGLQSVFKTIQLTARNMDPRKTLIGFAGAPFTVCTYLIEGGKSTDNFKKTKMFMIQNRDVFKLIIDIITEQTALYLKEQIKNGVDVVKIFDSHCSFLTPYDFHEYVILPSKRIIDGIKKDYPDIPVIGFPMGAGVKYKDYIKNADFDSVTVDYTLPLNWVKANLSDSVSVQGNLDPMLLASDVKRALIVTKAILREMSSSYFIFNTGHGILPFTPISNVECIIDYVKSCIK